MRDRDEDDDSAGWRRRLRARLAASDRERLMRILAAYAVACVGAGVFLWLDLPLPIFLGSLTACFVAAILDVGIVRPAAMSAPMRAVLGVAVGAAFTPALLSQIGAMAPTLLLIVPFSIVLTAGGMAFFMRVAGYDAPTAFFASVPGGLTDMVSMGVDAGASQRTITLIHATRIAFIVFAVPFVVEAISGASLGGRLPSIVHIWEMRLWDGVALVALAVAGWWVAERIGLAGAPLVGPMIASGLLHAFGVTAAKVPFEVMVLAQLTLGILLGLQFRGLTLAEFRTTMVWALSFSVLLVIVSGIAAVMVSAATGAPMLPVLLAFAPGGQTELNLLALMLNIDVAFVALHHLVRLAVVIFGAQMVFAHHKDWRRRKDHDGI